MKLPEYRNDQPLYTQPDNSEWEDLKMFCRIVGSALVIIGCAGVVLFGLVHLLS